MTDDNQLFGSAHAAMTFAYGFRGQPALSVMNRMGQEPSGIPGKGLSGLDGAGQAGMIRRNIATLGKLHEAILIAAIAPRAEKCPCKSPCCSGFVRNQEWTDTIGWLSDIVREAALDGHRTTHPIRRACVEVYFGAKLTAVKIAHDLDVSEDTAGAMIRKVRRYLKSEHERALIGADNVLGCLVDRSNMLVSS